MWTAAILAGGQARRFDGRDKSGLLVGGCSIVDRQIEVLREVAGELLIVTAWPERRAGRGARVVSDRLPNKGALGGIYTAIVEAQAEQTLVVACDMPFVTAPFLRHLLEAGRGLDAAVPRTATGLHPLCASYARGCAGPIRRRLDAGQLKVTDFLDDVRVREVTSEEIAPYGPEERLLFNVNSPADYARAARLSVILT